MLDTAVVAFFERQTDAFEISQLFGLNDMMRNELRRWRNQSIKSKLRSKISCKDCEVKSKNAAPTDESSHQRLDDTTRPIVEEAF